jgi:hypothetical protein
MPLDLQLRLDRPDMAGPQRRLGTDKLAPCSTAGDGQTYRQQVLACLAWQYVPARPEQLLSRRVSDHFFHHVVTTRRF